MSKVFWLLAIVSLVLCMPNLKAQHHHTTPDKPSVHGMVFMGVNKFYASHLPMFRSPHDYQIILELEMPPQAQKNYHEQCKQYPKDSLYTIEPEVFVLPTVVHETKKFKAHFYRGHFERNGVKFMENVELTISRVIYFKKFVPEAPKPQNLEYLLFGNQQQQFLAHLISAKPDFDQLLEVKIVDKLTLKSLKKDGYTHLEFAEPEQRKPYSWLANNATEKLKKRKIDVNLLKNLYLEFGDLE